jgi:hypothetical protein
VPVPAGWSVCDGTLDQKYRAVAVRSDPLACGEDLQAGEHDVTAHATCTYAATKCPWERLFVVGYMIIYWSTVGLLLFIFRVQRPSLMAVFVKGELVAGLWRVHLADEVVATVVHGYSRPDRTRCQFDQLSISTANVADDR